MQAWRVARKIIVLLTGIPLLVLGVILIPLPGPGILICFLALLLLSTELEWIKPFLDKRKKDLEKFWREYKRRQKDIDEKYK